MAQKAPGQHHRVGISLVQLATMFPDNDAAERWFVQQRWPNGITCIRCCSTNIQSRPTRKPQPYRCRDCKKDFSVKTGTLLHNSKLTLQQWAIAIYQMSTSWKGVSSMKLHRDLGITQKAAWHLGHRIRRMWESAPKPLPGPVEVDETYFGGVARNKHASKRKQKGRGMVGKTPVIGVRSRTAGKVAAQPIQRADVPTLEQFVTERVEPASTVYTDGHGGYRLLSTHGYMHESVNHEVKEYVRGQVHTNGIESFWALLKRGYHGTYHQMSAKHLHRYVNEFAGRFNVRSEDTRTQLSKLIYDADKKRLSYRELTGRNKA